MSFQSERFVKMWESIPTEEKRGVATTVVASFSAEEAAMILFEIFEPHELEDAFTAIEEAAVRMEGLVDGS